MLLVFSGALVLGGTLSATVIWLTSGLGLGLQPAWRIGLLAALIIVAVLREFHVQHRASPERPADPPKSSPRTPPRPLPVRLRARYRGADVRERLAPYVLAAALWLYVTDYRIALLVGATFGPAGPR